MQRVTASQARFFSNYSVSPDTQNLKTARQRRARKLEVLLSERGASQYTDSRAANASKNR